MIEQYATSAGSDLDESASAYIAQQHAAMRAMLALSAEALDPVVAAIEAQLEDSRGAADQHLSEQRERISARLARKLGEIDETHKTQVEELERGYARSLDTLSTNVRESRQGVESELRETTREAEHRLEDALLMAETVGAATIGGLEKELRSRERRIAGERARLDASQGKEAELLRAYRCASMLNDFAPETESAAAPPPSIETVFNQVSGRMDVMGKLPLPRLFIGARPYLWVAFFAAPAGGGVAIWSHAQPGGAPPLYASLPTALVLTGALLFFVGRVVWRRARGQVAEQHAALVKAFDAGRRLLDERLAAAAREFADAKAEAEARREEDIRAARRHAEATINAAETRAADAREHIAQQNRARRETIESQYSGAQSRYDEERALGTDTCRGKHDSDLAEAEALRDRHIAGYVGKRRDALEALERQWREQLAHVRRLLDETHRLHFPRRGDWKTAALANKSAAALVPFGEWKLDFASLAAPVRRLAGFLDEYPRAVMVPALLELPRRGSLLLQSKRAGRGQAIEVLRAVMLRLLLSLPPGRVHFTIIDPVGLGKNFAGFMHLVDYEEALVNGRIWTESEHIEARLTDLTNHMENVIQKYLRNEFEDIDAYNRQAGELAEPYRFLVVADFPANFNENALRRLASIVNSGARCGVFTLIAQDLRLPEPLDAQIEELAAGSAHLVHEDERFAARQVPLRSFELSLETPPDEEELTRLMHEIGRNAKDSLRVEVPFDTIAPALEERWSLSSADGVAIPIGHSGAVRQQFLRLGRGMAQHALLAGKTGSGKSTLLHVMITNTALWYSPREVEIYLVDFKKGVEFKAYVTHQLPHARTIAIESDREFGVSVLQKLDAEMTRRGELFRDAGVQDLAGYRSTTKTVMPRALLIVDEFQVFFTEDDKLAQDAGVLLDRLVRQGRAFGIHVLLGSQTLGGAASLARSTIGQMAIRIALQCSEADSQMILDDTNVAARLLGRPGEAVYNDAGGMIEGNSPFQTAWLSDERRADALRTVRALSQERGVEIEPPIVFEGNAPADIRQNRVLAQLLSQPRREDAREPLRAWLGEPIAIKAPTQVSFRRQSGAHLLLVGQREDAALSIAAAALVGLASQRRADRVRFVVLDGQPADAPKSGGLHSAAHIIPNNVRFVAWNQVANELADLSTEMNRRLDAGITDAPAIFLVIHALHQYRMLRRKDDDFSFSTEDEDKPPAPDKQFAELLREGPPLGMHVIAWCDTLTSLERTLERAGIGEFDHRVLFQMSASDSANLIDTPEANRLGQHRALLYSEEHGRIEKFRPYAALDADWCAAR